ATRAARRASRQVVHVVQLKDDATGIGGEEITSAPVRRSAFVGAPGANKRLLRSGLLCVCSCSRESVRRQRLHRTIDREVLHTEAERTDARRLAGGGLSE